jgi:hypothetical protein
LKGFDIQTIYAIIGRTLQAWEPARTAPFPIAPNGGFGYFGLVAFHKGEKYVRWEGETQISPGIYFL